MKKKSSRKVKIRYDKVFVLVLLILVLIVGGCYFIKNDAKKGKVIETEPIQKETKNYEELILKKENEDIDEEFLKWMVSKYGQSFLEPLLNSLEEDTYNRSLWHELTGDSYIVLRDYYQDIYKDNSRVTIVEGNKDSITISFAGDVSLADNWKIMPYYKSRNKGIYGILSEEIVKYMNDSDLMIVNNEFSFSKQGKPLASKKYTFRGNPSNVSIYQEMGVDLVTLANNHVYDYGKSAFLDTLETLDNALLPRIGAGKNIEEAMQPYYFIINGYKIAFVNATRAEKYILTPEATKNSPGVFRAYDPEPFRKVIEETKKNSDYVVALIHWGWEDHHELEKVQLDTGKLYIKSGADLVVGTHAHALQGVEFYEGKLIAYNLGDFIFGDLKEETGILTWTLNKDGSSKFHFIPALQENCKTSMLQGSDAKKLYKKMTSWSINGKVKEDGEIVQET